MWVSLYPWKMSTKVIQTYSIISHRRACGSMIPNSRGFFLVQKENSCEREITKIYHSYFIWAVLGQLQHCTNNSIHNMSCCCCSFAFSFKSTKHQNFFFLIQNLIKSCKHVFQIKPGCYWQKIQTSIKIKMNVCQL